MLQHLFKSREGQFFIIGTVFLIGGFILLNLHPLLSQIAFYFSILFLGYFAAKDAILETLQNGKLNVDLLMILSALGAVLIHYESEGAMLLLIFAGAEVLEDYATSKSSKAISELMGQVPNTAQLLNEDGEIIEVSTDDLLIGNTVIVAKGASIPIDGIVDRQVLINEAALTGESLPVEKESGQEVFAGTLNIGDAFHLKVNKTSNETIFSNIIRMVEEAQTRPSKIANFIERFESRYALGVIIIVPIFIASLFFFLNYNFQEAFYRGMVLLTVASPCALVASATPATLSAISNGAKNGVLVKGGAAMEALNTMDILFSDKTGTLTKGEFSVVDYQLEENILKEVVFMEQQSSHPIATAIVEHFTNLNLSQIDRSQPVEEIAGSGIQKGNIRVGKSSIFANLSNVYDYSDRIDAAYTTILVADDQQVLGYLSLADQIRPQAIQAVSKFQQSGVEMYLITGDNEKVAANVAQQVGIKRYQAACLPEDKINLVKEKQNENKTVGMIGDGINDAPALANADIGIAMGSGSSVAMESADIVIVKNDLSKLFYSYELSHKLNQIIKQNIIFAVSVIIILIILNLMGVLDLPAGVVFHEGSTILVILNGLRLLRQHHSSETK